LSVLSSFVGETDLPPLIVYEYFCHAEDFTLQLTSEGALLEGGEEGIELSKGVNIGLVG